MTIETDNRGRVRVSFGRLEWAAIITISGAMLSGWLMHDRLLTVLVEKTTNTENRIDAIERRAIARDS